MHMSEETPVYREGETVPVPDKGGWIDGETGPVLPTPPPEVIEPVKQPGVVRQPDVVKEPEPGKQFPAESEPPAKKK